MGARHAEAVADIGVGHRGMRFVGIGQGGVEKLLNGRIVHCGSGANPMGRAGWAQYFPLELACYDERAQQCNALDHGVACHAHTQYLHRPLATRAIASEQITLHIELSFAARSPWSSRHALCQMAS